ncbi:MAG: zinc-binding dehydrogenase [Acidobacteria bacterium]|nr:zinc-binding dehydrogenase [Acidobacteriota bacterium]
MDIRRAVLHGKCDLRMETATLPDVLEPSEILVRTEVSALSTGTDLGNYLGDSTYVPGAPNYPRWVGYSNAGRVLAVGSAVRTLKPGDRVFAPRPHQSHYIAKETDLLVRIPEAVSSAQASLIYLTCLGLAALRQAHYETGENIVVIGLGVIGLATVGLAKAMGASVVGVANSPIRARVAVELGASAGVLSDDPAIASAIRREFNGLDADIVVLTSNPWSTYFLALDLARYGGRVSILGFPGRGQAMPERNPLDPNPLYSKQLTLLGAGASPKVECGAGDLRFNLRRNLEYILALMATNRLDIEPLISHRIPSEHMVDAYELARQRSKDLVAAVFVWDRAE